MMLRYIIYIPIFCSFFIWPGFIECQAANSGCTGNDVYFDENTQTCKTCPTTCPPGYGYFKRDCGNGEMKRDRCTPCESGIAYSETEDDSRCHPCNLCPNQHKIKICTNKSSAVCGACHSGYGWDTRRETCTRCEHKDRGNLFGCEDPPTVSFKNVVNLVCELSSNRADTRYVWYRNDEALDTTDENKFIEKGKMLFILEPDDAEYYCKAVWHADNQHNFRIEKKSSNKAYIKEIGGDNISHALVNCTTDNKIKYSKNADHYCSILGFKSAPCHIVLGFLGYSVFATLLYVVCGIYCISLRRRIGLVLTSVHTVSSPHLQIRPRPQTQLSVVSLKEEDDITSIEMENTVPISTVPGKEQATRQRDNITNLSREARKYSSDLTYNDLDIYTTDRLAALLNPSIDPAPPIRFWKHLAHELGFTDEAELNHIGSYKQFHTVLHTKYFCMDAFLNALEKVENAEAIKVVCQAVIQLNGKNKGETKNEIIVAEESSVTTTLLNPTLKHTVV